MKLMGIQKNNTAKKCFYSKMIQSSLRSGKWIAVSSSMLLSIALLCTNNLPAVLSYSDGSSSATNTNGTGSPFRTAENNAPQRTDDTGLIEAIVFADTINNVSHASRLWECQGDCDSDSDCSGTLLCMQRDDNEYIPGCYGYEQYSAIDFCYDSLKHYSSPSDSENGGYNKKKTVIYNSTTLHIVTDDDSAWTMMENDIHNNDLDESSESQKIVSLGTCEGHCESDSDCMDNLLCMIRTNTNDPVPGCTGLRIGTQQRNFCYDPATTSVSTPNEKICLYQEDFDFGTVVINIPGSYILCEDISFCPNAPDTYGIGMPQDAYDPIFPSPVYDEDAFALGFFAALSIVSNSTVLELNGHSMQQCEAHALMQRFFSLIELAKQPFIKGKGPHMFVGPNEMFECGNNISILGPGLMGRTSHHAIHGNDNIDIVIKDIVFEQFEVAAIALNHVDNLLIENCQVNGNRKDVPVVGLFSAARFIRPYMKFLKDEGYSMTLKNEIVSASDLFDDLISNINIVYNDVLGLGEIDQDLHAAQYALFNNPHRVIDGPCYAFLIHGKGPAINGFGTKFPAMMNLTSSNVTIRNNRIRDLHCFNKEIPAAVENKTVVLDVRGSVLQFYNTITNEGIAINTTDGTYVRNVVADSQIMVAKAIHDGMFLQTIGNPLLETNLSTIPENIIQWAEGIPTGTAPKPPSYNPMYRCNGDSMHHVAKGIVVIRMEETLGFSIENNTIDGIINLSAPPFADCNDFHVLADVENANQTQTANIRGISVAGTRPFEDGTPSSVRNNVITTFFSENGKYIIGIDVQGDTKGLEIIGNTVNLNTNVRENTTDSYFALIVGENADDAGANSTFVIESNLFTHESLIQNTQASRRLRSSSKHGHHHRRIAEWKINADGLSELDRRNIGGCPFGR